MSTDSLQTRCPACKTVFAVSDDDLAIASGRVRCGDLRR
ncbi:MAG: MJ0042-type zinc finger domain-containing protein, partial [Pseudomonadota bacterium]